MLLGVFVSSTITGSLSGYLKGVDLSVDELFNIIHTMAKGMAI